MASTLHVRFESSECLPVGIPRSRVYAAPVALHHRTVAVCQTVCNCPDICGRMRRSRMRRVEVRVVTH